MLLFSFWLKCHVCFHQITAVCSELWNSQSQVLTAGALHQADSVALCFAAADWHAELAPLPNPLVIVNIGGPTSKSFPHYCLSCLFMILFHCAYIVQVLVWLWLRNGTIMVPRMAPQFIMNTEHIISYTGNILLSYNWTLALCWIHILCIVLTLMTFSNVKVVTTSHFGHFLTNMEW